GTMPRLGFSQCIPSWEVARQHHRLPSLAMASYHNFSTPSSSITELYAQTPRLSQGLSATTQCSPVGLGRFNTRWAPRLSAINKLSIKSCRAEFTAIGSPRRGEVWSFAIIPAWETKGADASDAAA